MGHRADRDPHYSSQRLNTGTTMQLLTRVSMRVSTQTVQTDGPGVSIKRKCCVNEKCTTTDRKTRLNLHTIHCLLKNNNIWMNSPVDQAVSIIPPAHILSLANEDESKWSMTEQLWTLLYSVFLSQIALVDNIHLENHCRVKKKAKEIIISQKEV